MEFIFNSNLVSRFEAERQMMKWNSNANPIFRQATTTIQNPMYCKDS